jgi:uncharacterized repeat protein (TIGR03803 family)
MRRILHNVSTCILCGVVAFAILVDVNAAHATTFTVLYSFTGTSDGGYPDLGSLIIDKNGDLYGTTGLDNNYTAGTVFKLALDGTLSVLHTFFEGSNGFGPEALTMDTNGILWGPLCCGGNDEGCGGIFEITSKAKEKLVHRFDGPPDDGCSAYAALIADANDNFYGTTSGGGKNNDGTVFQMAPDGSLALLHSFKLGRKGNSPLAGVIMDASGNLYGTNGFGGSKDFGNVFKLTSEGVELVLHTFKGSPNDGREPQAGVITNSSGILFGDASYGGEAGCGGNLGCGIVFDLDPDDTETVLHLFSGKHGDGANPLGGLIADGAGNLYGTTEYGGSKCKLTVYGCGIVFEIAPDGTETILHKFSEATDGANPVAGLVADSSGNLYGTASMGGAYGYGTVFEITP